MRRRKSLEVSRTNNQLAQGHRAAHARPFITTHHRTHGHLGSLSCWYPLYTFPAFRSAEWSPALRQRSRIQRECRAPERKPMTLIKQAKRGFPAAAEERNNCHVTAGGTRS